MAFGILFIFFKLSNRNGVLGFQDFIIERFALGGVGNRAPTPVNPITPVVIAPIVPVSMATTAGVALTPTSTFDPLADITPLEAPFNASETGMEPIQSPDTITAVESSETDIPDWLKVATESSRDTSAKTDNEIPYETLATIDTE